MSNGVKITMTHIFAKGLLLSMSRNRRDVGRISWGYVNNHKNEYIFLLYLPIIVLNSLKNQRKLA